MAFTYVGAANGQQAATLPAHQAGDIIIGFVFRNNTTSPPTTPSGGGTVPSWTTYGQAGTSCFAYVVYAVATASGMTTGTWTGATVSNFFIYRPDAGYTPRMFSPAFQTGTGTSVTYSGVTRNAPPNSGIFLAAGAHRSTDNSAAVPTGFTVRANATTGSVKSFGSDLISPGGNFSGQTIAVGGTSNSWISAAVEICEYLEYYNQLAISADDCYDAGGTYTSGTTTLRQGNNNAIGVRFADVPIPQASQIVPGLGSGFFLIGSAAPSGGYDIGSLYAVAQDDLSAWSSSNHPATVTKTTSFVTPNSDVFYGSPVTMGISMDAPINEVFARSGWASGNALGIVGNTSGANSWTTIYSAEAGSNAPTLYLAYVEGTVIQASPIAGSASITEADDTVASVGRLAVKGTLTRTEADDAIVSAGNLAIAGAADITEDDDTVQARQSATPIAGELDITEDDDLVSGTSRLLTHGAADIAEDDDTMEATSVLRIVGRSNITEERDTLSSESYRGIEASFDVTEDDDTCAGVVPPTVVVEVTGNDLIVSLGAVQLSYGYQIEVTGNSVTVELGTPLPLSWTPTPTPTATWVPILDT